MPVDRGRHDHIRHRPVLPADHAAQPGGIRRRRRQRRARAATDARACRARCRRAHRRQGAARGDRDGARVAGQHPGRSRGHARGDQPAVQHELLVSRGWCARGRRGQDRDRAVGRKRSRPAHARMVRLFRSVHPAGDRTLDLRRARRAFGGRGRADRRRRHEVLPRKRAGDPRLSVRLDRVQPAVAALLCVLGVMTVFSAGADWARQVIWVAAGAAAYVAATIYDYRRLRGLAPSLYAVMLVALLAVHLVGHSALGARRWLSVAGFPLEPSELSKLLLVIVLAAALSRESRLRWRTFGLALVLAGGPAVLILTQPDLGTTIVVVAVCLGMLFGGRARPGQLAALAIAALAAIPLLPFLLHGYQRRRLEIFLNPYSDPLGAGYNLLQA